MTPDYLLNIAHFTPKSFKCAQKHSNDN